MAILGYAYKAPSNRWKSQRTFAFARGACCLIAILVQFILPPVTSFALAGEQQTPEALSASEIKASYIFNFAKFVGWPEGYLSSTDNLFEIGIFGNDKSTEEIYTILKDGFSDKFIGGRKIHIRRFLETDPIPPLHILYISPSSATTSAQALQALAGRSTLIVSDSDSGSSNPTGAMIHFFMKDERINFCIDADKAKHAGIKISDYLTKLSETTCK